MEVITLESIVTTLGPLAVAALAWLARRWHSAEGPLWSSLKHQQREIDELRLAGARDRAEMERLASELRIVQLREWVLTRVLVENDIEVPEFDAKLRD